MQLPGCSGSEPVLPEQTPSAQHWPGLSRVKTSARGPRTPALLAQTRLTPSSARSAFGVCAKSGLLRRLEVKRGVCSKVSLQAKGSPERNRSTAP